MLKEDAIKNKLREIRETGSRENSRNIVNNLLEASQPVVSE